jgi:oligo-1,6-glucosidase
MEIYSMMNWWFEKSDGFRMDVIRLSEKTLTFQSLRKLDKNYEGRWDIYFASGKTHSYLQEMNKEVLSKHDVMSVAEGAGMTKKLR